MLGANWQYCWWSHGQKTQGGLDFHLDTLSRELRPVYEKVLRGGWAANARGEAPIDPSWSTRDNKGYGKGGLWSALTLYQKKAAVAAAVFKNGTSSIPVRHVGPSVVPTKVSSLIAKWPVKSPALKITTDAAGTMAIPAVAFASTTSQAVEAMKSFGNGEQLLHADINPNTSAVVYEVTVDDAGTRYLTVNHSTWHLDQYLMVAVNGATKVQNIPIYYTIGYWNESQPVAVELVKGKNTLTFTREGFSPPSVNGAVQMGNNAVDHALAEGGVTLYRGVTLKEFFLYVSRSLFPQPLRLGLKSPILLGLSARYSARAQTMPSNGAAVHASNSHADACRLYRCRDQTIIYNTGTKPNQMCDRPLRPTHQSLFRTRPTTSWNRLQHRA
jgi:hypothetical protein